MADSNSDAVRRGIIKSYSADRGFGFIKGSDNRNYHFHAKNGVVRTADNEFSSTRESTVPKVGDEVFFVSTPPRWSGESPSACPWAFAPSSNEKMIFADLALIPQMPDRDIQDGDLEVDSINIGGDNPITWWKIVFRPSTREVFKVYCWDGEGGSCDPVIPKGSLPTGSKILNRKAVGQYYPMPDDAFDERNEDGYDDLHRSHRTRFRPIF